MSDFFRDIYQQSQISEACSDASYAKHEVRHHSDRIRELEFWLQRMALASQAMWELFSSRIGITDAELLAKINEIDLRDGVKDQRISPQLTTCPNCNRTLGKKNSRCIYCGENVPKPHVFQ